MFGFDVVASGFPYRTSHGGFETSGSVDRLAPLAALDAVGGRLSELGGVDVELFAVGLDPAGVARPVVAGGVLGRGRGRGAW